MYVCRNEATDAGHASAPAHLRRFERHAIAEHLYPTRPCFESEQRAWSRGSAYRRAHGLRICTHAGEQLLVATRTRYTTGCLLDAGFATAPWLGWPISCSSSSVANARYRIALQATMAMTRRGSAMTRLLVLTRMSLLELVGLCGGARAASARGVIA